jgi:hypothetical protein
MLSPSGPRAGLARPAGGPEAVGELRTGVVYQPCRMGSPRICPTPVGLAQVRRTPRGPVACCATGPLAVRRVVDARIFRAPRCGRSSGWLKGLATSRALPTSAGVAGQVARAALVLACSTAAFYVVGRGARRLVPLAMLLWLSLVFPDQAPSRFGIALGASNPRRLQDWGRLQTDVVEPCHRPVAVGRAVARHRQAQRPFPGPEPSGATQRGRVANDPASPCGGSSPGGPVGVLAG